MPHSQSFFSLLLVCFEIGSCALLLLLLFWHGLASHCDTPKLCLPCSWDYWCELRCLALFCSFGYVSLYFSIPAPSSSFSSYRKTPAPWAFVPYGHVWTLVHQVVLLWVTWTANLPPGITHIFKIVSNLLLLEQWREHSPFNLSILQVSEPDCLYFPVLCYLGVSP
jgi:hypothetical protein